MEMFRAAARLLVVGVLAASAAGAAEPSRSIRVVGEGTVSASPDMATVHSGVVTQAEQADEALKENSTRMQEVMRVLRSRGIADKDIQTSNFSVTPVYESPPQQPRAQRSPSEPSIVGYRVHNQVRVKVRDLSKLGAVLDELVSVGSNQISGIEFGVDDTSGILDQARSRAIRDAKRRAEVYAQAAGVTVGRVEQISEQPIDEPPRPMPMMQYARAESSSVPVASGEQQFQVRVHVVYQLQE